MRAALRWARLLPLPDTITFALRDFRNLEEFPYHLVIARVLKEGIVIILDEIEKGAEVGIAGMLGELFVAFR